MSEDTVRFRGGGTAPTPTTIFPLSIDAGGRFLRDATGQPFMIVGESVWSMAQRMSPSQVDAWIADRKARGYNAAMVMSMRNQEAVSGGSPPNNYNGDHPFTTTPWCVPANVNSAYWNHLDLILTKFYQNNMVMLLAPCYSGGDDTDGFWDNLTSDTVATNWGQWIGARYNTSAYPNIIWVSGGDRLASPASRVNALGYGVYQGGGTQLHTNHNNRFHNAFEERGSYTNGTTWLTLNNVYCDDGSTNGTPFTLPEQFAQERAVSGPHPVFLIEDWYLDEHSITDSQFIVEKYQAMCSGACGFNTGSSTSWTLLTGYEDDWDRNAHVGVTKLVNLFNSYNWWTGVPKQDTSLVSSSLGTQGPNRICPILGDYTSGKWAIVLVPTATSPTVVMTNFSQSSVRARWMDIVTGSFTTVSGSPFANTGSQSMTHPGNNSLGTAVQVLVLDAA